MAVATRRAAPTLSDQQLDEMLGLIGDSFESEGFGRLLVALWSYPDNSRQGVDLGGDQEAKTLKFFSARLAAKAAS